MSLFAGAWYQVGVEYVQQINDDSEKTSITSSQSELIKTLTSHKRHGITNQGQIHRFFYSLFGLTKK